MKDLTVKIQVVGTFLRQYVVLIVIIIFGAMYGFLILTSTKQVDNQPGENQISEKLQGTTRPKLDEAVANKLNELEEQNIEIQSIFQEARNNPFTE